MSGGPRLSLRLLGEIEVRRGAAVLRSRDLGGGRARQILVILALARGGSVAKSHLVSRLWGEAPPACALATLESHVSVLRKRLEPDVPVRDSVVRTVPGGYALVMARVACDLEEFDRLLASAREAACGDTRRLLRRARELSRLRLLDGEPDSDWVDQERARHARRGRDLRLAAGRVALADHLPDEAAALAEELLAEDPLDEAGWLVRLEALTEAGRLAEGLRAYDRCRALFSEQLGCAPGPVIREAYHRLLRGTGDDGLEDLLAAVTRLHQAASTGFRPGDGDRPAAGPTLEDSVRLLRQLLSRSPAARQRFTA
jgi:DNA-binding SARP family transcriptional activator